VCVCVCVLYIYMYMHVVDASSLCAQGDLR
jgi:hypothetical protein